MAEVKRGYRKLTVIVPVAVFDHLKAQADDNDREVGQQAAFLLRRAVMEATNTAIVRAMENGSVDVEEPAEVE